MMTGIPLQKVSESETGRIKNLGELIKGNVCSDDLVTHVLKVYEVTHIIHFAAQSHVQRSFDDSLQFTQDNIVGTHTLLECARKYGKIEKFIHVSTDEVYGESMNVVDEQHTLTSTNQFPLSHQYVVAGTVVVTNQLQTQTYIENVDYLIVVVGAETRLQRLSSGSILDGEDVLADYTYDIGGSYASPSSTRRSA